MKSRITMFCVAAATIAASNLLPACRNVPAAGTAGGEKPTETRQVRVVQARLGALPRVVSVAGTLAAEDQVALAMKVAGRVSELLVDMGSRVDKGQVLARLVPTDFELRVRQAEASLDQARSRLGLAPDADEGTVELEQTALVKQAAAVLNEASVTRQRVAHLYEQQLLSRSDLDKAEADYQVAEGRYQESLEEIRNRQALLAQRRTELDLARQQRQDAVLTAPYAGAVRERLAAPGQFVAAGQPIVTLVRVHPLRLKLAVPEREAAGVAVGQQVRLSVEGDQEIHTGRVARLSPSIAEGSRTLMLEAEIPNPDGQLRPGAFASAEIVTESDQPVVFVPLSAIVTFAGMEKVIVVEDGRTIEKRVRTGRRNGEHVELLEGVKEGENVVVEPGNLVAGQTVTIVD